MNSTNTDTNFGTSCSDNSHIFGQPIRISEGVAGFMDIPILDKDGRRSFEGLDEWCRKVDFLQRTGIEMHLRYVAVE